MYRTRAAFLVSACLLAAYFSRGSHVFQAAICSGRLKPEVAEPFFSGLRFE